MGQVNALSVKTAKGETWEQAVIAAARRNDWSGLGDGAVKVALMFFMPRPKRCVRVRPSVRPDLDKLVRSVLDALQRAGVYEDDARVCRVDASKHYATTDLCPGVEITVESI
jgi:Holliday junction resolvase RusA-like endonuclease